MFANFRRPPVAFPSHHVHGLAQVPLYQRARQIDTLLRPTKSFSNASDPPSQR